jgi:hypothetical protein
VSTKFIPCLLIAQQKAHRVTVATNLLECAEADEIIFKYFATLSIELKAPWTAKYLKNLNDTPTFFLPHNRVREVLPAVLEPLE